MRNAILWILRLVAAVIMLQTLFFKFTGAEDSIYIFTQIGMEPWGRYAIGTGELIAGILLLVPSFSWLGAIGGIGLMAGAVFFHLTIIGIEVKDDGGTLFIMALAVLISCIINVAMEKGKLVRFVNNMLKR